jgi:hypothetical protein
MLTAHTLAALVVWDVVTSAIMPTASASTMSLTRESGVLLRVFATPLFLSFA